jgi:uncharacterized membrane protein HdeD (DUF308 family)
MRGETMSAYGLARNWWWIVLRGLFAVLFVLAAFFGTYLTLGALVLLFGAYSLAGGWNPGGDRGSNPPQRLPALVVVAD